MWNEITNEVIIDQKAASRWLIDIPHTKNNISIISENLFK